MTPLLRKALVISASSIWTYFKDHKEIHESWLCEAMWPQNEKYWAVDGGWSPHSFSYSFSTFKPQCSHSPLQGQEDTT